MDPKTSRTAGSILTTRAELLDEAATLLQGAPDVQRLARANTGPATVTAVLSQRVHPDKASDFRRAQAEIGRVMRNFDGFIQSQLLPPVAGLQDEYVILFSFASTAALDLWIESPERREVIQRVDEFLDGTAELSVLSGFGSWFPSEDSIEPRRWRQAAAVLLALYPTTLVLVFTERSLELDVPWQATLLVSDALGVAALTWLLMPVVTRVLRRWLNG